MARKGSFTQASIAQKTMLYRNIQLRTVKELTINSSNTSGDCNLNSHDNEVKITVVEEVVGAPETDEQSPKYPPGPPVEVFTTTVSNVLEWSVAETLIKAGRIYSVGVEKKSLKGGGDQPQVEVRN